MQPNSRTQGLQVIVGGLELPPQWRTPALTSYKVSKPALMQLQQKIRELGRNVLVAEAAARAKAAIQIKELQDTIQNLETEISNLGQQLDEQQDQYERQRETLVVLFVCSVHFLTGYDIRDVT